MYLFAAAQQNLSETGNENLLKQLNGDWENIAPITFYYESEIGTVAHRKEASEKLYKFYFGWNHISQARKP